MTAADAARRLGVSISAIHHAIRRRALRAVRHGLHKRGAWEISPSDFAAYAAGVARGHKRGRGGGEARAIELPNGRVVTTPPYSSPDLERAVEALRGFAVGEEGVIERDRAERAETTKWLYRAAARRLGLRLVFTVDAIDRDLIFRVEAAEGGNVSDQAEGKPWSSWDTSLPSELVGVDADAG